ncbi:MAG: tyrosine--tRNA ligase [Pyramidobacter sp.]|uniref:tyrosine--tRNA ligase n=1 Tax=Pyramidobacter sp. TaxID=1943581 RepID=UPI002A7ED899|nr:tyrosine--tRNA ligase [Pyramidobacter sp.]MDY4031593.1 tyrosine--tRNA ligase [Pyramidobacter sp.]
MAENALEVLRARGFIDWTTDDAGVRELFDKGMVTAYVGFDPTADSLHVGHLIPLMGLAWLQRLGHRPIVLAGGGTGMIGDPSMKSAERNLLTMDQIRHNVEGVKKQLTHFVSFDCGENSALLVNNYDWLSAMNFLEFLRDVGKFFTINKMIAKEHVRSRIEDPTKSLSFTEFAYTLLQSYDFYHLYTTYGCRLQLGGNDQQGNITSGIDFIRKHEEGAAVYGGTNPLLLTSAGHKFGKTEGGAVWLDPAKTSPYQFYQFWVNSEDATIAKTLRYFTFLPLDEIDALVARHMQSPEKREAQRVLAYEITRLVHGENVATNVRHASEILFGGAYTPEDLTEEMLHTLAAETPCGKVASLPMPLADALAEVGACKSKGEAKRLIAGGGVSVNGVRADDGAQLEEKDVLCGYSSLIRLGKKKYFMIGRK